MRFCGDKCVSTTDLKWSWLFFLMYLINVVNQQQPPWFLVFILWIGNLSKLKSVTAFLTFSKTESLPTPVTGSLPATPHPAVCWSSRWRENGHFDKPSSGLDCQYPHPILLPLWLSPVPLRDIHTVISCSLKYLYWTLLKLRAYPKNRGKCDI